MSSLRLMLRRFFNRFVMLNFIVILIFMSLWYWSRSVPLLKSFSGEDYLFYAKVHYARQSNTMGRFVLKTNADNNAEYILWLNKKNKKYVESWLNPNLPVEINAKRVGKYRWVITSMHSPISNLHFEDLLPYRRAMTLTFTAISLFLLVFLITTAQEYVLWHRHRPWFKLSQDQDKSS